MCLLAYSMGLLRGLMCTDLPNYVLEAYNAKSGYAG
jgi:hypothetical protein